MEAVPAVASRYRLLQQLRLPWKQSHTVVKPNAFPPSRKISPLNPLISSSLFTQSAYSKLTVLTLASSDKNGGGNHSDSSKEGEEYTEGKSNGVDKVEKGILMSQRFTLAYAALLGFGGIMGYVKSGSQMSLAVGGSSALVLCFVYNKLRSSPVLASVVGLISSATLLVVMWLRFVSSGRFFPPGVIAAASFIMSVGYLHGMVKVMRKCE